jgi:hypothetical protein
MTASNPYEPSSDLPAEDRPGSAATSRDDIRLMQNTVFFMRVLGVLYIMGFGGY